MKGPKEAPVALYIVITLDDVIVDGETNTDDEAYRVNVDAELQTIKITANNPIGAYHGVQTLRSLLAEKGGVPGGYVADYPRFPYRSVKSPRREVCPGVLVAGQWTASRAWSFHRNLQSYISYLLDGQTPIVRRSRLDSRLN